MNDSHGTHMNESWYTRMSRGTHTNDSCVTPEWAVLHIWMRHVTLMNVTCDMPHIWMRHGTIVNMNDSCHAYEWVMTYIWMSHNTDMNDSHVTRMNESRHTYELVMSRIWMTVMPPMWMSHVMHMDEACYVIWMRHVTHMHASWHAYEGVMSLPVPSPGLYLPRDESCHTYERFYMKCTRLLHSYSATIVSSCYYSIHSRHN
jgi:hypothetical protein